MRSTSPTMNARDLKVQASTSIAKGRFDRAEVLYRQALTLVPRDSQLWLKHGETLRHLGHHADAVESYRMAATILATDGHFLRAIAAVKQALELRPADLELTCDIIKLEMRHSQARARPTFVHSDYRVTETPAPSLALPMLTMAMSVEVVPTRESPPEWPQVRRLSDSEVAMKATAQSRWVVVSSVTPLVVRFAAELDPQDAPLLE